MPLVLVVLTASVCIAGRLRSLDLPEDFPTQDLEVVGFIGTVTDFETPVYGLCSRRYPVSLVHVEAERYIAGSWKPAEFVSFSAVYFDEHDGGIRYVQGTTGTFVFLKPGMRIIALAARFPNETAVRKGYDTYGGRFVLTYVREIRPQQDASGKTTNRLDKVHLGSYALMRGKITLSERGHVRARDLVLDREPTEQSLEELIGLIDKTYNAEPGETR
jgi:hypothetical protein